MQTSLALGVAGLACAATAGVVILLAPPDVQPGATAVETPPTSVVSAVYEHLRTGRCRQAADHLWFPADLAARRDEYEATCRRERVRVQDVEVGEPHAPSAVDVPYGATDYLAVPVTLTVRGRGQVTEDLDVVEVDGEWFVSP